ncbi:hypothetical protein [Streptomyces sp. NPDC006879]|uniref:hypothetical protein n=1 Tax=Streptomyces sp. NPDC006879 TaxID=3364767 RepID=UPI0036C606E9
MNQSDSGPFERDLLGYARHREDLKGFVARLTVALLDRPDRYVHLDQWSTLDRLLRVVHENTESHALRRGIGRGPSTNSELLVSVGHMRGRAGRAEAGHVLFVHAKLLGDPERFELDFGSLVGQCIADRDFAGSDLLRSVADPDDYTGLLWWRDEPARERVSDATGFRARLAKLAASAQLRQEPGRLLS